MLFMIKSMNLQVRPVIVDALETSLHVKSVYKKQHFFLMLYLNTDEICLGIFNMVVT